MNGTRAVPHYFHLLRAQSCFILKGNLEVDSSHLLYHLLLVYYKGNQDVDSSTQGNQDVDSSTQSNQDVDSR
jgi:hypothetical protein